MSFEQQLEQEVRNLKDRPKDLILFMHQMLNLAVEDVKKTFSVTCKKGCSHCCYMPVSANKMEVGLILEYIKEEKVEFSTERMNKQINFEKGRYKNPENFSPADWVKNPIEDRKCMFLTDEGLCSIYSVRPLECKGHFVVSPVEQCVTDTEEQKRVQTVGVYPIYTRPMILEAYKWIPDLSLPELLPHMMKKGLENDNLVCD